MSNFVTRNPSYCVSKPRKAWAVRKAMAEYKEEHPYCQFCGRGKKVQVHHSRPVSRFPELAADKKYFVTLCAKRCHLTVGHAGNFQHYIHNVLELCHLTIIKKDRDD